MYVLGKIDEVVVEADHDVLVLVRNSLGRTMILNFLLKQGYVY